MILVMAIVMLIQTFMISNGEYSIEYSGNTLWVVLGINIYLVIYAINGWAHYKAWNSPLLTADRGLAFSACLLSLYSLFIAIIDRYKMLENHTYLTNGVLGYIVMGGLLVISVYMIIHGSMKYAEIPKDT